MTKKKLENVALGLAKDLGKAVAKNSASKCWLLSYHQKECPKSLLKKDK